MIALQIFKHDEQPLILSKVERTESGAYQSAAYIWTGNAWKQRTYLHCATAEDALDTASLVGRCQTERGYSLLVEWSHRGQPRMVSYPSGPIQGEIATAITLAFGNEGTGAFALGFHARTNGQPSRNPYDNGNPEDDERAEEWAKGWLDAHRMYWDASRELSAAELADLPLGNWENFTEDPTKYTPSFMYAFEVDESTYKLTKHHGDLCRVVDGKYIVVL